MSGRHRGASGTRGISKGPIIAVATVALLVLAVLGWFQLRDRIDEQATAAAGTCVEGDLVLHIAADPLIAPALTELAQDWTADGPRIVRDHCITAEITSVDTTAAITALTGEAGWNTDLGPQPSLWIPLDTAAALRADTGTGATPRSLARSPIVLAAPTELANTLTAARITWSDLPALQTDPAELAALGLPRWGTLRAALPTGARTDASTLALAAVAAAASGVGTDPLTVSHAGSPAAVDAVSELALGANALASSAGPTTSDVLTALAAAPDPAAPVHSVPVIEKQLHDIASDGHEPALSAVQPAGATPVADFPAVVVDAPWTNETLARAADEIVDYIRQPDHSEVLLAAGFRTPDQAAGDEILAPVTADVAALLRDIRLAPMSPRKATILVDTSTTTTTTGDGLSSALADTVARSRSTSVLGLYTPADSGSPLRTLVVRDGLTANQRTALSTALDDIAPTSTAPVHPAILAAYTDAVENYDPTRPNSLLVIVGGNDSGALGPAGLLRQVTALTDPATPVRIDVLAVTDDLDDTTVLEEITELTGGSFRTVTTGGSDLADTLRRLLS